MYCTHTDIDIIIKLKLWSQNKIALIPLVEFLIFTILYK